LAAIHQRTTRQLTRRVGVVGSTADALHNGIDNFFSNIRARLGI
jgi:hypothetical protein